jgi:hypothetical protein
MSAKRPGTGLGSALFFGAICGVLVLLTYIQGLGANPVRTARPPIEPAPIAEPEPPPPPSIGSNNYIATNANAIWSGVRPEYSTPVPADYSTLQPSKPISQMVHGYKVTLYPMYASANLIVMTYTVAYTGERPSRSNLPCGPDAGEESPCGAFSAHFSAVPVMDNDEPRLTGEDGTAFPWLPYFYEPIPHDNSSSLLVFGAYPLSASLPEKLGLRLVLNKAMLRGTVYSDEITGPFIFDFTMDVDPIRRVAEVHQTATETGGQITIDRVIVTRYDLRVEWRVSGKPAPTERFLGSFYCCILKLVAGKQSVELHNPRSRYEPVDLLRTHVGVGSFLDEEGTWKISTLYREYDMSMSHMPFSFPGPVFRFLMLFVKG